MEDHTVRGNYLKRRGKYIGYCNRGGGLSSVENQLLPDSPYNYKEVYWKRDLGVCYRTFFIWGFQKAPPYIMKRCFFQRTLVSFDLLFITEYLSIISGILHNSPSA